MKKTAVITGGSKGIGKALIVRFAKEGFDIITCARNEADLLSLQTEVQKNYNISLVYQIVDLGNKEDVKAFGNFVNNQSQSVDVLINNAGFFEPSQLINEQDGFFEKTMDINVNGVYYLTRSIIPFMIKAQKGHIFNICSIASNTILPNCGAYGVSKFAVYGMTKILRAELKAYQIKVTAVLPGATLTPNWDGVEIEPDRLCKPEDVADAVYGCYNLSANSIVEEITIRPQLGDL